ncbi:DeoR family transcriptional regulator [Streptomyces sp. NPDC007971]|uniref:DeoR family transcriptional regulator n=1 Tax=Streptomyces sp. NPDC007971 TaxID=3364799 RepID=UPI0036E8D19B
MERRHHLVLRVLRSGGPAADTDLSGQRGVSPATVRRDDLVELPVDGPLTRVHGGAVADAGDQPFAEATGNPLVTGILLFVGGPAVTGSPLVTEEPGGHPRSRWEGRRSAVPGTWT